MVPQSRPSRSAPPASRRRPARSVRLRCEAFEDRITPTNLFTVHAPYTFSGLNNNGCVAVADFDHNGFTDAVLSNYGPSESSGTGNKITIIYGNASGFTPVQPTTGGTNGSGGTGAEERGAPALLDTVQEQFPVVVVKRTLHDREVWSQRCTGQ